EAVVHADGTAHRRRSLLLDVGAEARLVLSRPPAAARLAAQRDGLAGLELFHPAAAELAHLRRHAVDFLAVGEAAEAGRPRRLVLALGRPLSQHAAVLPDE